MFRSVFAKYITAFMLIIVVSFAILAAIISSMMVNYSTEIKRSEIDNAAYTIRQSLESDYFVFRADHPDSPDLRSYLLTRRSNVASNLWVLTRYTGGLVIVITDLNGQILSTDEKTAGLTGKSIPDSIVQEAVGGDTRFTGDLGGLLDGVFLIRGTAVLSDGLPVGAVFACSTASGINSMVQVMIKTIVMASLWVLLAALIAVYFISERIIAPLKDMSVAAKSFAAGKFDVRVPVTGHDEVSELAVAFNNMAGSLAHTEEMRRTFLGNVSHELRTPMTTIAGFIDGILDGAIPPEKQPYYLGMIASEVRRLSRLVNTLLDISRIQAGDRKFNMTTFDICEMATLIVLSFEQRIEEKKLDVDIDFESDKMFVSADRDAIYQILYNLCDNAVKFSREGGKYRIRLMSRDKKVYVSVYNEGKGIPEEELPFVFDRFYKSDRSRSLDKTGVGLGLYIAKTIIDAHGEEIWVSSVYGEYCEFVFTLRSVHESAAKKYDKKHSDAASSDDSAENAAPDGE